MRLSLAPGVSLLLCLVAQPLPRSVGAFRFCASGRNRSARRVA